MNWNNGGVTNWLICAPVEPVESLLDEVRDERAAQDEKWGKQNHPSGTGWKYQQLEAFAARARCDDNAEMGTLTWFDILREEFWEAAAEEDADRLREELIQVAAVAVAWVEAIDRAVA